MNQGSAGLTVEPHYHAVLDARDSASRNGGPSFSLRVRVGRTLFRLAWVLLAAWTPPQARAWRRFILRRFGAKLGRGANIYSSVWVWYPPLLEMGDYATLGPRVRCYNQARITIGAHAIVSQDASLCAGTHDHEDPQFQLVTRPIWIGANAWIAAEAFVGPGVCVGEHAVLGARAVAMRDLEPGMVYSGNPAVALKRRSVPVGETQG